MDTVPPEIPKTKFLRSHKVMYLIFPIILLGIWGYSSSSAPTDNRSRTNRQPTIIHIARGQSLSSVALDLENKRIIKHDTLLKIFLTLFKLDKQIERGDYLFDKSLPVWSVAWMLARGDHNIEPVKITFKEGITNEEMLTLLSTKLSNFRRDLFISDERYRQGYLFPDTYFFYPFTTSDEIISEISRNFTNHINPLKDDILNTNHSEEDIVIMASILEKEAKGKDDAHIISGILWKRIKLGMSLQVDAARETYSKVGLPSKPIANPGAFTLDAAIHPEDSPYLFYLHDKNGVTHYGKTFAEHKSNINKYLR